jgi:hypothetical protein
MEKPYLTKEKNQKYLDLKARIESAAKEIKPWQHPGFVIPLEKQFDLIDGVYRALNEDFNLQYTITLLQSAYHKQLTFYPRQ